MAANDEKAVAASRDKLRDYYVAVVDTYEKVLPPAELRQEMAKLPGNESGALPANLVKPGTLNPEEELSLWKAYWVAKVKTAIVNAKLNYERPISKVCHGL